MYHCQPLPRPRSYTKNLTGCWLGVDCGVWPRTATALDNKIKKQIERRTPTSKMVAQFLRQLISQLLCRRFLIENARTRTTFRLCRTAIRTGERKAVPAPGQFMDRDRISIGFINIGGASINESTPVVNHPQAGIYLNLRVEIVPSAVRGDVCGHFANLLKQPSSARLTPA